MRRSLALEFPTHLADVASLVRYTGSQEHKSYPSFSGPAALRSDASKCDPNLSDQAEITAWLRDAIRAGRVSSQWEGEFPRYVWHIRGGTCYEGRLINRESGEYKGYPLEDAEWPQGI